MTSVRDYDVVRAAFVRLRGRRSARDMAHLLHLSEGYVRRLTDGRANPGPKVLNAMRRVAPELLPSGLHDHATVQEAILTTVLELRDQYTNNWRGKSDIYWLKRLLEEAKELELSLYGQHEDTPERELQQIASICLNWLEKRASERVK